VFDSKQIHAYLRSAGAGHDIEQVGPFLATFTSCTKPTMRNYAIPDDDAQPTTDRYFASLGSKSRRDS